MSPRPTTRNGAQGATPVRGPHPRQPDQELLGAPGPAPVERGARFQLSGSPWARAALLADPEQATRLGLRARDAHAAVGILGKSPEGPWVVRIGQGHRILRFAGRSLYGLIAFGLDRWEAGASDAGIRWTAGPDGLAHGHEQPGRTLCRKPPIEERWRHPERSRCAACWIALDGRF